MRIVVDTNVIIAAFISHGACSELLEHCVINHDVILSDFILDELADKLVDKFNYTRDESKDVVRLLRSRCSIVASPALPGPVSKDPDDDRIISTAIAGACQSIITGDRDLLDLGKVGDVLIVAPAKFWQVENDFEAGPGAGGRA